MTKIDTQLVELAGRNWLAAQLQRAGIEVARPERDRGVDLIAYVDLDSRVRDFIACPIQLKATSGAGFSLDPKYAKFPGLILAYVWNVAVYAETKCYALTWAEALAVAEQMGWTKTDSWRTGGKGRPGYTTTKPSSRLRELLAPFEMDSDKWWQKITGAKRGARIE